MIEQLILSPTMMAFLSGLIIGLIVPDKYGMRKLREFGVFLINKLPGADMEKKNE